VSWKILAVAAVLFPAGAALAQSATPGLSERYTACRAVQAAIPFNKESALRQK
jgi:hypothetical protein